MSFPDPMALAWFVTFAVVWVVSVLAGRKHEQTNRRNNHDVRKPCIRSL